MCIFFDDQAWTTIYVYQFEYAKKGILPQLEEEINQN